MQYDQGPAVLESKIPFLSNDLEYVSANQQNIPQNSSYTCQYTGFYVFVIKGSNGSAGQMFLDSERTKFFLGNQNTDKDIIIPIPLKANTTVYTRASYGVYTLLGYYKV